MKLSFFDAAEYEKGLKCTIHKNGRLGFSSAALKRMGVSAEPSIRIGKNDAEKGDETLYIVPAKRDDKSAFRLSKTGDYFYANTKNLFDSMGLDYQNHMYSFDLVEVSNGVFKLQKRSERGRSTRKRKAA
jgi:hypothetical protein